MLEEQGIVSAVEVVSTPTQTAYQISIDINPSGACGQCSAQNGCGTSSFLRFFTRRQQPRLTVLHDQALNIGQVVQVGLTEKALLNSALLVYLLPLLSLFLGAFAALLLGYDSDAATSAGGVLGLFFGIILARQIAHTMTQTQGYQAIILRVHPLTPQPSSVLFSGDSV